MQRFEPRYRDMREQFSRLLPRPEDGILPLRVLSVEGDTIRGKTPDGHDWEVTLQCYDEPCQSKKSKIPTGRPVIFEWKISGKEHFDATEIEFPSKWMPKNIRKKDTFLKKETSLGHESEEKREE